MLKSLFKKRKKIEKQPQVWEPVYNKIYPPFYNIYAKLDGKEPEVYDKLGNRIHVFFIRDKTSAHASSQLGHHILWDKYNFAMGH